jgi:hypothetical protein
MIMFRLSAKGTHEVMKPGAVSRQIMVCCLALIISEDREEVNETRIGLVSRSGTQGRPFSIPAATVPCSSAGIFQIIQKISCQTVYQFIGAF